MDYPPTDRYPDSPPTSPGVVEKSRPKWPIVIGIIAIVLASLGILMHCFGVFSNLMQSSIEAPAYSGQPMSEEMTAAVRSFMPFMTAIEVLKMLLAIGLLIGGIGLVCRKGWSATALRVWGWSSVPIVLLGTIMTVILQQKVMSAMVASQGGGGMPPGFVAGFTFIFAVMGLIFSLAFPVFILVWFAQKQVKEETASWQ